MESAQKAGTKNNEQDRHLYVCQKECGIYMAQRNRQTAKKREREMAKRQKQQDKAKRIADRKAGRTLEDEEAQPEKIENGS